MHAEMLRRLLAVAKREEPADKVIRNGKIVNVFTNRIEEAMALSIKDGYVVGIEPEAAAASAGATEVIDARGRYLCPGFIDAHTHLDSMYPFHSIVPYCLKGGTTSIVSEAEMVATSCGLAGMESFFESAKGYPVRCFFLASPETPPFPEMETAIGLSFADFEKVLAREDVLGIGEAYWTRMVDGDDRVLRQAALALSQRKTLEGHGAGAKGNKLVQYLVTGITSDHESTTLEEALERLRFGVYVMIRQGFVRQELAELSKLKDTDVDKRRIILVSDGFDPVMYRDEGYLDSVVRKAIEYGFSPMDAVKMATINVADYYGLRRLGALAPFRHADVLFLDDLETVSIGAVMANGEMVVKEGNFLGRIAPYKFPDAMKRTIKTEKTVPEDFTIPASGNARRVRVIHLVNATITRETESVLAVSEGRLQKDLKKDIIPVAAISRGNGKRMGKGFITGTGIREGAFATSLTWDTGNLLVAGSSEADMALAVNRLIDLQGGYVIVRKGEITYEFGMPVFGLMPECPLEENAEKAGQLDARLAEIGSNIPRPFLALQTIPFTGLPFLRISDKGLADMKSKRLVPLFLD